MDNLIGLVTRHGDNKGDKTGYLLPLAQCVVTALVTAEEHSAVDGCVTQNIYIRTTSLRITLLPTSHA